MLPRVRFCMTVLALSASAWAAEPSDPAAARAQLQIGYDLKEKGRCADAIAHFVESVRLDPQPKGFLNLADCEEKVGRLSAALAHAVQARDLATSPASTALKQLAEQRIRGLEAKLPKLTLKLGKDAPNGTVVLRDGVELGAISLGVPLPMDPGNHTILVRAGNAERQYELTLKEGETKELEVSPGRGTAVATRVNQPTPVPEPKSPTAAPPESARVGPATLATAEPIETSGSSTQRTLGFVSLGLGVVGVAVGTVFAFRLMDQNKESDSLCRTPCSGDEQARYYEAVENAEQARTLSIVGFGAGAAFGALGGVLLLTAPASRSTSRIWPSPAVGPNLAGVVVRGSW